MIGYFQFVMMFDWLGYGKMKYDDGTEYQDWAEAIGWMCTMAVVLAIFVSPIYYFVTEEGSFMQVSLSPYSIASIKIMLGH